MHSRSSGPTVDASDPLATVIELLRPQTVLSKIISGAGRWSVRYDAHEDPGFCVLLEGSCFLDVEGAPPLDLREGDFVLLPATPGFTLSSDRTLTPKLVVPTQGEELRHGSKVGPPTMRMLGGYFHFDRTNAQLLVRFLPRVVLIRRGEAGATRLRRIVELIGDEATEKRPGGALILQRLVEVLLVEALRFRPATAARQEQGLLAGLADPALGRAIRRIHADVARRWTVADLARAAGMSRAVFAERFTRTVGLPPLQYLLEWRIAIAKDVLRRERAPLAEVAEKIGYQSASAFSTAFTRHAGCTPSAFARAAANASA
jgi:AraC-like DNA-binding protein